MLPCHAMTTVGVQMEQKQIRTRIALLAVATIFIVAVQGARAADECLEKPNAPSPQGSHWYYRTDRTTNRQCWYLSPERGKVAPLARQDTAPAQPSSKMSAPSAQTLVQATAAETATAEVIPAGAAAPIEITAGQGNTSEANSTVTLPTPPISSDRGSALVRDSYVEEQSATAPQEMGLTGSIVVSSPEKPVRELASSFSFTQFCALLAVVLGLAAIIGRMIFTRFAVRRPMPDQSQSAQEQLSAASTDEHLRAAFAHDSILATVGYQVDAHEAGSTPQRVAGAVIAPDTIIRTSAAAAHEAGMADSADWVSSPPSDTVTDIESTLQRLLHELEQHRPASCLQPEMGARAFAPQKPSAQRSCSIASSTRRLANVETYSGEPFSRDQLAAAVADLRQQVHS